MEFVRGESGVKRQARGFWIRILEAMKITTSEMAGDAFLVDSHYRATVVHKCARQVGIKVKSSMIAKGKHKIWRVE